MRACIQRNKCLIEFLQVFIGHIGLHLVFLAVSLPGFCIRVIQGSYWTTGAMKGEWRSGGGVLNWERGRKCNSGEREKERERTPRSSEETMGKH